MKCLKIGCEKEAKPGFEACNALHGSDLKMYRTQIKEACKAIETSRDFRSLYTIEEALTYLN